MSVALGKTVTLTGTFRNKAGALADPSAITLTVEAPDGTQTVRHLADLTHVSTGVFAFDVSANLSGTWRYRYDGDGAVDAEAEGEFEVERSLIGAVPPQPEGLTCTPWAGMDDFNRLCDPVPDASEAQVLARLQEASDVLYLLSNRRWPGVCEDSVRPCGIGTSQGWGVWGPRGSSFLGVGSVGWTGLSPGWGDWPGGVLGWCGCNRPRSCGCRRLSEVRLPGRLPISVTEVLVDGDPVDPSRYRLDDGRWLVLLPQEGDGLQAWPCCQDLALPDTDPDTFSISFTAGSGPPIGGVTSACVLARETLLACSAQSGSCRLPQRVQTINRQGVSMAVLDPLTLFDEGRTGLPEVDQWLASLRYGDRARGAAVLVPGRGRGFRRPGAVGNGS